MDDDYVIDSDALDLLDETASVLSDAILRTAIMRYAENEEVGDIYTKYVKRIDVEWASMRLLGEELWNRMMDTKEAASKRGYGPNGEYCKQHAKRFEKGETQ